MIPPRIVLLLVRFPFLRPYFHRRNLALARRPTDWHIARRRRPQWQPPEPVRRGSTFQPRLYDRSGLTGYVIYTETFTNHLTVLHHLDMLAEGPLQWKACAFSVGFLESLLDGLAPQDRPRAPTAPGSPALPGWASQIPYFDWLESAQQAARDNAEHHTEFLLSAFRRVERQLLEGRSISLQVEDDLLPVRLSSLPKEERERRVAELKALCDLDPAAVAETMASEREAGRAVGRAHRSTA